VIDRVTTPSKPDCGSVSSKRQTSPTTELNACAVCGGDALEPVLDLPDFPLTGLYVREREPDYRGIDQGLLLCAMCGHAQLRRAIDPHVLYADTYTHRSGESPIATAGNDAFARFLLEVAGGATFRRIVEIGCNDLYLLTKVADRGETLFGIDPIWRGATPPAAGNIHVIGKFIQDVDFAADVGGAPDLVLSAHTFEHIADVADQLARIVAAAADDALFVVEVPDFDSMLRLCRFDQVFHQHIQYFSLASFRRLLQRIGGRYVAHRHNYRYWGGTMLVAFRKDGGRAESGAPPHHPTATLCIERLALFRRQLDEAAGLLHGARQGPLYGYGAAQMLPTLAYHMKTDFGYLDAVLDDNPARQGLCYPNLAPVIRAPDSVTDFEDATVVLTALDSARPILQRLFALGAKDIVLPLHVI
jgi:Methyltransferase domain/Putative zinc binding domain/C-methyltransferase C-terminal domain